MKYFQDQVRELTENGSSPAAAIADPHILENNCIGRRIPPVPVGGLLLAFTLGSWAFTQTGSAAAGPIGASLASLTAYALPKLMVTGIVEAHAEVRQSGVLELESAPRREDDLPEDKIQNELLAAEMLLAAGNVTDAIATLHAVADLIAALPDEVVMEKFETFCNIAQDALRVVCDTASGLEVATLQRAAELARVIGSSEFEEHLLARL